jgi:hypothetical protein
MEREKSLSRTFIMPRYITWFRFWLAHIATDLVSHDSVLEFLGGRSYILWGDGLLGDVSRAFRGADGYNLYDIDQLVHIST